MQLSPQAFPERHVRQQVLAAGLGLDSCARLASGRERLASRFARRSAWALHRSNMERAAFTCFCAVSWG
jgi:hypothetical protein